MTLDVSHIAAGYPHRTVLRDLTLQAQGGQVLGVIGANGAGKTTLLRVIGGTLPARAGSVRLGDLDLARLDARRRAQKVAVVPQGARLPEAFSVAEVVLLGRTPYLSLLGRESDEDRQIAREAMTHTDTLQLAERRIAITLQPDARAYLAKKGYDTVFGARPLARVIQAEVRDRLTDEILFGALENGGNVTIGHDGEALTFTFAIG